MLKHTPNGAPRGCATSSAYDTTRAYVESEHSHWAYDKQKAKVRPPVKRTRIPQRGFMGKGSVIVPTATVLKNGDNV